MKTSSDATVKKNVRKIFSFIYKTDYKKALSYCKKLMDQFPNEFVYKVEYASTLGDYSESCKEPKKTRLKKESIYLMRKLLQQARWNQDKKILNVLKNEYYWQTNQRVKQYNLGKNRVSKKEKSGYYSMGAGSAWHSYELAEKGQLKRADRWAQKSITAWKKYIVFSPNYYNSFVHFALAQGVLNNISEMTSCLKTASRLSGKNKNYREFKEIENLITVLNSGGG